jgi:glutathione synthase/RimK-type ligase-like ATP-grasp enzyme
MVYWNNKLGKYRALLTNAELARHLPPTKIASKSNVNKMLEKNGVVYLKPSHGTGGFGIFKLSRLDSSYLLQNGSISRSFSTFNDAYVVFEKAKRKKTYLVQKGIPLLRYRGRPFDFRIMVQLSPQRKFEVTGLVGRLARTNMIVTNYHNGGKPMPIRVLLAPFVTHKKLVPYEEKLKGLCLRISSHMRGIFPRFRAYGVDIGIDKGLKPWIIEVNTRPDKYIFNALSDKRMFRKIMRYGRLTK